MAYTHPANQPGDRGGVEDISDHSIGLALVEASFRPAGDDAARILAAVLEKGETFADLRSSIDRGVVQEKA
ncbi:hypothetical protein NUW54_g9018 [Trametes sanguinea]|uniref:Uncharacterized protein n=1 Tax=Trametes sanguinea TaxID=158606 RepID=A0ACC1P988_9APHY|nr:hypothetical protein NUW54_g9018 [Trametes sanguinea]